MKREFHWLATAAVCFTFAIHAAGQIQVVTNTADEGEGSLRQAITMANQHAGLDSIVFNIPDTDDGFDGTVWWIRPLTMLPAITDDSTFIMGSTQEVNQQDRNTQGPDICVYGGDIADPNQGLGFLVYTSYNTISGLVISGFASFAIRFRGETAQHNQVWGNYIGIDPAGEQAMANLTGIYVSRSAGLTVIGGGGNVRRNVISGNTENGVYLTVSDSNLISGNYIGTDRTGTMSVPNGSDGKHNGVCVSYAQHNTIGGTTADTRNIISGNGRDAIHLSNADSNRVVGNYIGVDVSGANLLANGTAGVGDGIDIRYGASYNIIGGTGPGEKNIICGSPNMGVRIGETNGDNGTNHNLIIGNYIGTDINGEKLFGHGDHGVYVLQNSRFNVIGSNDENGGNCICANTECGIMIRDRRAGHNIISGNLIGIAPDGATVMPNGDDGVQIADTSSYNVVGPGNVISGNGSDGVDIAGPFTSGNHIFGNIIGLSEAGIDSLPNLEYGIHIAPGTDSTIIGSIEESQTGNVISGNRRGGIVLDSAMYSRVYDNFVGTDASGVQAAGNRSHGIKVKGAYNEISGNCISGNIGDGVFIYGYSSENSIRNNIIGMTCDKSSPCGNAESGVYYSGGTQVSNDTVGPDNSIAYNSRFGVELSDSLARTIVITQNSITANDSGGIVLKLGANENIQAPAILQERPVGGSAPAGARIELFSDTGTQGLNYEGFTTANDNGEWEYTEDFTGPNITAVAIDEYGNTSEFSAPFDISGVEEHSSPVSFFLGQNYPNPFNPDTRINFCVTELSEVIITVYNVRGQKVADLGKGMYSAGVHTVTFNAGEMKTGLYIYKITCSTGMTSVKKMLLIR